MFMALQPQHRKIFWHLFIIFLFLCLGIGLIGYFYYKHQVAHIKQDKQNDVAAILDLKIQQIVNWRLERLADAKMIREDHFFAQRVKGMQEGQEPAQGENKILSRMQTLTFYQYQRILLINKYKEVILSSPRQIRHLMLRPSNWSTMQWKARISSSPIFIELRVAK